MVGSKRSTKRKAPLREDPSFKDGPTDASPRKRKAAHKTVADAVTKQSSPRKKHLPTINLPQSEHNLRRSRRRAKISVEVTVTASDEEDVGGDEVGTDFAARHTSMDLLEGAADLCAVAMTAPQPSGPRFYEMTPHLLESLMAPVGLYQSLSEDGLEKELRLRMPIDFGGICVGVSDILFNEHLGIKIDGATDWMPVNFVGDYLDPESIEIPDVVAREVGVALEHIPEKQPKGTEEPGSAASSGSSDAVPSSSLRCQEEFHRIAPVLDMNIWMQTAVHAAESRWLWEHDYSEPTLKFGRPRSANILQDAVSAFNKYVNFIRLSERREPFLFGLWWEREDAHTDYWLLPKPREEDAENDRQQTMVVIPIANEWTEEVVVASEEIIDIAGTCGVVSPMTFWDNRGFLSFAAWSTNNELRKQEVESQHPKSPDPRDSGKVRHRKRTTATPVARAPRFLAPKLDPSTAFMYDGKLNSSGLPENLDELVSTMQSQHTGPDRAQTGGDKIIYSARSSGQVMTAAGSQLKNMSKEKLDEIDFAMRCIKELQQRRHSGPCRLHCRICDREFTAPTSLIVHYRSHAGIKPFTCPICLTSFTRRHSLKYHMLCHSGQARFRCALCDRLFRHSGHYRDHMRKHEHGMPFKCTECNRVFATRTTYRRHMAVIHSSTNQHKGRGRSVGVSKLYARMEGLGELDSGELGEVAEEIEYDGEEEEEEDEEEDSIDALVAEEVRASRVL